MMPVERHWMLKEGNVFRTEPGGVAAKRPRHDERDFKDTVSHLEGPGVASYLTFSSTMKLLCYYAFTFLCPLFFLPRVLSIQCSKIQYEWPIDTPRLCCDMCPPGDYLVRRPPDRCVPECQPCIEGRYTDTHNVHMYCELCDCCNKPNMEYESQCNGTHNAVCRCKAGYRCDDQPCKECVPIPPTTTSTPPPSTTALKAPTFTTLQTPFKPDTMWFLVIIGLLSTGFAFIVIANIKPFLRWIRYEHGYFLAGQPTATPTCSEDEDVSTPVQEVCGKCDQPIDV